MSKVVDRYRESSNKLVILCDLTPPRSSDQTILRRASLVNSDFLSVAYNPGKLVRMDSIAASHILEMTFGRNVAFNLATRDMNKLALQSHLLGAEALGLKNVIVVQGDKFTESERTQMSAVDDFTTTGLIRAISNMNEGKDYRGSQLRAPTDFCIGATFDLGRELDQEIRLVQRKMEAGSDFLITQPTFGLDKHNQFLARYEELIGHPFSGPVFWGVQILVRDGITLGPVPSEVLRELEQGRSGVDIAVEALGEMQAAGVRGVYLVPPILRGGARDYEAAQEVLDKLGNYKS